MTLVGPLLALGASAAWTVANANIGPASRRFGSFGALVWAQLLGLPAVIGAAILLDGPPSTPDGTTLVAILGAALAAAASYAGLFEAFRTGQLSVVTPVISAWAALSVLVAVVFLGETLSLARAVGVVLVVGGNVVLTRRVTAAPTSSGGTPPRALAWALLSALGFGALVPLVQVAGDGVGRLWAVPAVWTVELAVGVPLLLLAGRLGPRPRGASDWALVARVGLAEALGFVLLSTAVGLTTVGVASPMASLATVLSVLWGAVVLRERTAPGALPAALAASLGVVLVGM